MYKLLNSEDEEQRFTIGLLTLKIQPLYLKKLKTASKAGSTNFASISKFCQGQTDWSI